MDNLGVNFAPTGDNAGMGQHNAALTGVPEAIQVMSMALPRVLGARPVAPASLLGAPGAQGNPNVQSALLQTILRTLGLPGGTAGPDQGPVARPIPRVPGSPFTTPSDPAIPSTPPPSGPPHIIFQPNPGPQNGGSGGAPPAPPRGRPVPPGRGAF
jgi:hypothetical protein